MLERKEQGGRLRDEAGEVGRAGTTGLAQQATAWGLSWSQAWRRDLFSKLAIPAFVQRTNAGETESSQDGEFRRFSWSARCKMTRAHDRVGSGCEEEVGI